MLHPVVAPWEWGELDVAGRAGDDAAIAHGMAEDIVDVKGCLYSAQ